MKVLIIEDEPQTAWDLREILLRVRPGIEIAGTMDSVETAKEWLLQNPSPDLIFSDIKLGDGLSFEIFKNVKIPTPIVFCTAFDEYVLQAFKTNGIDYILKPIQDEEVKASLDKFETLKQPAQPPGDQILHELAKSLLQSQYKSTIIVSFRDKMYPIPVASINMFKLVDRVTELYTSDNNKYTIPCNLEYLEQVLNPEMFYRANRQAIISRHAVAEIEHYFERKLLVYLKPINQSVLISKAKSAQFLNWMEKGWNVL